MIGNIEDRVLSGIHKRYRPLKYTAVRSDPSTGHPGFIICAVCRLCRETIALGNYREHVGEHLIAEAVSERLK